MSTSSEYESHDREEHEYIVESQNRPLEEYPLDFNIRKRYCRYRGWQSKYNVNKTLDLVFPSRVSFQNLNIKLPIQLYKSDLGQEDGWTKLVSDEDGLVHSAKKGYSGVLGQIEGP
jgi:hypothetical protein